jgi:hypothetical protein
MKKMMMLSILAVAFSTQAGIFKKNVTLQNVYSMNKVSDGYYKGRSLVNRYQYMDVSCKKAPQLGTIISIGENRSISRIKLLDCVQMFEDISLGNSLRVIIDTEDKKIDSIFK